MADFFIFDNNDGTWTAQSDVEDAIIMLDATTFEITSEGAEYVDVDTYTITGAESTTLVWDQVGDRLYETGISKGVLYKEDTYGVAWNGLTAIEIDEDHEVTPVHFDGVKFNDIVSNGDLTATLRAFTYPDEFLYYEGVRREQVGFFITNQPFRRFGLSYQTVIGDDIEGVRAGYKIHILYNLTALPSAREYQTLALDVEPLEFEWDITSIPEELETYRPTSHVIIDSRQIDPHLLKDIESLLYGDDNNAARLPPLQSFGSFIRKWDRLTITDHGDGTWTAETLDDDTTIITMIDDTTFQIVSDTALYWDAISYSISSSEKNEEDIWQP